MNRTLLTLLLACTPMAAHAQSNPLVANRERDQAPPVASAPVEAAAAPLPNAVGAPHIALTRIVVEGGVATAAPLDAALLGRPMDAATIRAAADAVAAASKARGVALYTVQVPSQDFAGGVLRLRVIEGFIEEAVIHGQTQGDTALLRAYAERLTREKPLTRASLERYISLIRDIPGLTPEIQLLQGTQPGGVKLAVGVEQKRGELAYTLNTRAQPLLGETQMQVDWTLNGLLRQGDQTRFTGAVSSDFDRYRYVGVTHSQPIGASGARAQVSAAHLRTQPDLIAVEGKATTLGLTVSYPWLRSYDTNLILSGGIDGLDSDSAVFGQSLATEQTRVLRAGATYSRDRPRQSVGLSLGVAQGLDALGASLDPLLADAEFTKLTARGGFDRKLGRQVTLRLRGMVQASSDALPASEQMALGGAEFGRAFDTALLLADRGSAVSMEVAWSPLRTAPPRGLALGAVYAFADAGELTRNARPTLSAASDHLSSAGLGLRVALGSKVGFGVEAAKPIDTPAAFPSEKLRWSFSLAAAY